MTRVAELAVDPNEENAYRRRREAGYRGQIERGLAEARTPQEHAYWLNEVREREFLEARLLTDD
jgi:hypothetical protein